MGTRENLDVLQAAAPLSGTIVPETISFSAKLDVPEQHELQLCPLSYPSMRVKSEPLVHDFKFVRFDFVVVRSWSNFSSAFGSIWFDVGLSFGNYWCGLSYYLLALGRMLASWFGFMCAFDLL